MPDFSSIRIEIETAFSTFNCIETVNNDFGVFDPISEDSQANEPCKIVPKDKGHFRFTNSKSLGVNFIPIDKGLIPDSDSERFNRKCDYAICAESDFYFGEIKNVRDAHDNRKKARKDARVQIANTIKIFSSKLVPIKQFKLYGLITLVSKKNVPVRLKKLDSAFNSVGVDLQRANKIFIDFKVRILEGNDLNKNFIDDIIEADLDSGKHSNIVTRFPPEPNGYLHIGHAKSICLNFGLGLKYAGKTNLRFDDTNPAKEEIEYVDSIREDVKWLIDEMPMQWSEERYASDYFQKIYELTVDLIKKGLAYVDDSTSEQIATMKGTPTKAGVDSPFRSRSIAENLQLFDDMKNGRCTEGSRIVRAKIDMASPNMLLRDPAIYRIKFAHHHQTGNAWCIYPMYDYAHPISDAIEGITHSVCTLEFEVHRPFYEWTIKHLDLFPSRQIEFARLNLTYTIMSKRKLMELVQQKVVNGWNDPRMPTISGMRRRGYTAASLREFANRIGIAKRDNMIDVGLLEFCVREDLNKTSQRLMAVLNPLKVVLTNYTEGAEFLDIDNNPEDENAGKRQVPFSKEIYIEQDDFMEEPPKGYHRLTPNGFVRLKGAYIIEHQATIKDENGNITELHCRYILESKSGNDQSGLKVKGVTHWVSAATAMAAECRIYDRLFTVESPDGDKDHHFLEFLNPNSLQVLNKIYIEPSAKDLKIGQQVQFLRHGYFCLDADTEGSALVFNRTVTLKDSFKKG
jgi:glutaminyl-tRNA synthetase